MNKNLMLFENNNVEKLEERFEIFNNENLGSVRIVIRNNEPWFCLKDCAKILNIKNHKEIVKRFEEDEVGRFELPHPQNLKKKIKMIFLNETALYELIIRSEKKESIVFKKWITKEVLPSIRKHGIYMKEEIIEKTLADPDFLIAIATQLKNEKEARIKAEEEKNKLEIVTKEQEIILIEQKPKIDYYENVLNSDGLFTISQIAKDFGISSGTRLNKILNLGKIIYKQGKNWLVYSEYAELGLTKMVDYIKEGKNHPTLKWTNVGRKFIYDTLIKNGYIKKEKNYLIYIYIKKGYKAFFYFSILFQNILTPL